MAHLQMDFLASRSVGAARRKAVATFLGDFADWLAPRSLADADAHDLDAFLSVKLDAGFHPNTVRKWLVMARAFYRWLYDQDVITGATMLAIRELRPPRGSSSRPQPRPYTARELRELRAAMDARWPRLTDEDARRVIDRWRRGTGSYRRVRAQAIRLQLDAVIALALDLGLRRAEIFALSVDAMHPDNAAVIVWRNGVEWSESPREVPYTADARRAVGEWLAFRSQLGADHDRPWVQLWAGPRAGAPMKRDAFDHLLGNYVAAGWTYKRLRDTCAVRWLRAGLPIEHARRLLGIDSLDATLPYAALVTGTTGDAMRRVEARVGAAVTASG